MSSDYGFAIYGSFTFGFGSTLFSSNFWWGGFLALVIAHGIIWAADHAFDDPTNMMIDFQLWFTWGYPLGAFTAMAAVHTMRLAKLINVNTFRKSTINVETIGLLVFVFSSLTLAAAVNFLAKRYSATGMSPILLDPSIEKNWGIATVIVGSVGLIGATIAMLVYPGNTSSRRTWKYLWVMAAYAATMGIHDSLVGDIPRVWTGVLTIVGVLVVWLLAIPWTYYVKSDSSDPLYKNARNTRIFILVGGGIAVLAATTATIVDNITTGDPLSFYITMLSFAAVVILVLHIARGAGVFKVPVQPGSEKLPSNDRYDGFSVADQLELMEKQNN